MPDETIREAKRRLRREVVARVLAMEPRDRRNEHRDLDRRFLGLPGLEGAGTVLLYVSHLPEEVETARMIRDCLDRGRIVLCPRVDRPARMLRLHRVDDPDRDLVPGGFGIPEPRADAPEIAPECVDWALVPGIAFDGDGYRLGRGAGYYDRLLPTLRPETPRWSLCYSTQWVDALPVEPHDERLDGVISPTRSVVREPGRWME